MPPLSTKKFDENRPSSTLLKGVLKIVSLDESLGSLYKSRHPSKENGVTFQSLNIRFYDRSIGDNPSVVSGPPISLGWNCVGERKFDLNEWERHRGERRKGPAMLMPRTMREEILRIEVGCSRQEINEALRRVIADKKKRLQTINNMNTVAGKAEEKIENTLSKVKGIFRRKSSVGH